MSAQPPISIPTFDPAAWIAAWKDAGGTFAMVNERLAIGQVLGAGADRVRLRKLARELATNPGQIIAVSTHAQPIREADHG